MTSALVVVLAVAAGSGAAAVIGSGELTGLTLTTTLLALVAAGLLAGVRRMLVAERAARELDATRLTVREQRLADDRAALVQLVSHELRTPLTVIRGGVETLQGSAAAELDGGHQRLLHATWRATLRLESMVHVVLAAAEAVDEREGADADRSRLERLVRSGWPTDDLVDDPDPQVEVALEPLLARVAGSLAEDLPERLRVEGARDLQLVTVEPYLWVTLRCLLDNASKFSPPGAPIEVRAVQADGRVRVDLVDHGPGLPEGYERLAFEPFTQADASLQRSHTGIGMGLYTARRLARRLGGDVLIGRGVDGGTVATLVLPDQPADTVDVRGGGAGLVDLAAEAPPGRG